MTGVAIAPRAISSRQAGAGRKTSRWRTLRLAAVTVAMVMLLVATLLALGVLLVPAPATMEGIYPEPALAPLATAGILAAP